MELDKGKKNCAIKKKLWLSMLKIINLKNPKKIGRSNFFCDGPRRKCPLLSSLHICPYICLTPFIVD